MPVKASTGLRNHVLATGSVKSALDGGFVKLYAGTVPATADAALGAATLLCVIYSNGVSAGVNLAATASDGAIAKAAAETWSGTNVATGTATFFRHVAAADDGGASITAPRLQGTVGVSGADLNISNTNLIAATPQALDYYNLTLPTF